MASELCPQNMRVELKPGTLHIFTRSLKNTCLHFVLINITY